MFAFAVGCYAQRFGPRGVGHGGMSTLGLMCDVMDVEWQRYLNGVTRDPEQKQSIGLTLSHNHKLNYLIYHYLLIGSLANGLSVI